MFAVPGSPLDPRAEGTNDLLRDGANLCARPEDVLSVLEPLRARDPFSILREEPRDAAGRLWGEPALLDFDRDSSRDAFDAGSPDLAASEPPRGLRARIVDLLGPSPISIDELARAAEAPISEVRIVLLELDLAGRLEHSGGARVSLTTARGGD